MKKLLVLLLLLPIMNFATAQDTVKELIVGTGGVRLKTTVTLQDSPYIDSLPILGPLQGKYAVHINGRSSITTSDSFEVSKGILMDEVRQYIRYWNTYNGKLTRPFEQPFVVSEQQIGDSIEKKILFVEWKWNHYIINGKTEKSVKKSGWEYGVMSGVIILVTICILSFALKSKKDSLKESPFLWDTKNE